MKTSISYGEYIDKVHGAFIGKAVIGTLGAPYEGIKMPLELSFRPEMIDTMLPNDDLDLQILWLDVVERYGLDFTSDDLLERFVSHCDYSPGEYALMRKNFKRGIHPPLSGIYSNDFYLEGMGCPIRSEIWACLAPLNPTLAAELASRDGVLDHGRESVYAEQFLAALESAAFGENDLYKLIDIGISVIPSDCRFRELVEDVLSLCAVYDDAKLIFRKIMFKYGHPDCTNLFQNMGIVLISLLKCDMDFFKTGMTALNCGFDTDCTCATAGAILGLIRGGRWLGEQYGLGDTKYVLGVRAEPRSDSIRELSHEIAELGAYLSHGIVEEAPQKSYIFEKRACPVAVSVSYADDLPVVSMNISRTVTLHFTARTAGRLVGAVDGMGVHLPLDKELMEGETYTETVTFSLPRDAVYIDEINPIRVSYRMGEYEGEYSFGLVGATPWKVVGPIWRTDPPINTEMLLETGNYWDVCVKHKKEEENIADVVRRFHLNMACDTETDYMQYRALLSPICETAPLYEETLFEQTQDMFTLEEACPFVGNATYYFVRQFLWDHDETVYMQIGHTSPFSLMLNGEKLAEVKACDAWDAENVHLRDVPLKKGINTLVVRLNRANGDVKFNAYFTRGEFCAEQIVGFRHINPRYFGTIPKM